MAMRSIQRLSINEGTPYAYSTGYADNRLLRDQMPATLQMAVRPPTSPIYSPDESDVTIRASDHPRSTPSTRRVRILLPPPREHVGLPDEPHYPCQPEEEESRRWWSMAAGWAGFACFFPIKLCVYASRASRSETVASRVA